MLRFDEVADQEYLAVSQLSGAKMYDEAVGPTTSSMIGSEQKFEEQKTISINMLSNLSDTMPVESKSSYNSPNFNDAEESQVENQITI